MMPKALGWRATQIVHERLVRLMSEERDQPPVLIKPLHHLGQPQNGKRRGRAACRCRAFTTVERAAAVTVESLTATGNHKPSRPMAWLMVCIQHELDHLMGKVFVNTWFHPPQPHQFQAGERTERRRAPPGRIRGRR